ncbi:delta-60 repeat domain-containing protein [Prosthecobacter debontii]|uniref:Delta-60 repeat domain-containing protein n=2 Tax=Prosthecobacter debontii TaxID=48467 RepID=A0A1T4XSU3_9BACT|nr:delta-60 repeat domain-containing protein [Prosthecobacter debontii]
MLVFPPSKKAWLVRWSFWCSLLWLTNTVWAAGEVDPNFNPDANNNVYAFSIQPDDRIVIGGNFTSVGGQSLSRLTRLLSNGLLDPSFPGSVSSVVYGLNQQADRKLLLSGYFNTVNGQARGSGALLSQDGVLGSGFNFQSNQSVEVAVPQADGGIIVGGFFTQLMGATRNYIARVNAGGELDTVFNPDANDVVRTVAVTPEGKIIIAGSFTTIGGTSKTRIARLNADGSLDDSFLGTANGSAYALLLQPDGKILLGGNFTSVGGVTRQQLARLNTDGSLDTSFPNPALNGLINSMVLQANGKIIIGGQFTSVQGSPRNRLARLNSDGSLDSSFDPNVNSNVHSLMLQKDGRLLVGGVFSMVGSEPRNSIARLTNDAADDQLAVISGNEIQWLRGGSSPEVNWTEFEVSMDGGTQWVLLGKGERISGGWQMTNLNLPDGGYIRARGIVTGGRFSGSSWWVESLKGYHRTMVVEQPAGQALENITSSVNFGPVAPDSSATREFTLKNTGAVALEGLSFSLVGLPSSGFSIKGTPATTLQAGENMQVAVILTGSEVGDQVGSLRIVSNASQDAFDIHLTGQVLSFDTDSDGDGLNDASELQMAALGFDWQISQGELVATLFDHASKAGLYTADQVQTLNIGARLVQRNAATQSFSFSIGLKKSTDLVSYEDVFLTAPMATFTAEGKLEFQLDAPEKTQFFRLEAH